MPRAPYNTPMPAAVLPPIGKMRCPKMVSSSSTPPARPHPALTKSSAATCEWWRMYRTPSNRSEMPLSASQPSTRTTAAGRESKRVLLMK